MSFGGGKYGDVGDAVRQHTSAAVAVVVIVDGNQGHGLSVTIDAQRAWMLSHVPAILHAAAAELDRDAAALMGSKGKGPLS